jgi:hypothetical protein
VNSASKIEGIDHRLRVLIEWLHVRRKNLGVVGMSEQLSDCQSRCVAGIGP